MNSNNSAIFRIRNYYINNLVIYCVFFSSDNKIFMLMCISVKSKFYEYTVYLFFYSLCKLFLLSTMLIELLISEIPAGKSSVKFYDEENNNQRKSKIDDTRT